MSDTKKQTSIIKQGAGIASAEESYRLAKLLRTGEREVQRQMNTKKTKRLR